MLNGSMSHLSGLWMDRRLELRTASTESWDLFRMRTSTCQLGKEWSPTRYPLPRTFQPSKRSASLALAVTHSPLIQLPFPHLPTFSLTHTPHLSTCISSFFLLHNVQDSITSLSVLQLSLSLHSTSSSTSSAFFSSSSRHFLHTLRSFPNQQPYRLPHHLPLSTRTNHIVNNNHKYKLPKHPTKTSFSRSSTVNRCSIRGTLTLST